LLANLLTNAARYNEEGGHITLTAVHAEIVVVTVKDNRVGIAPDRPSRIFDLFFQVDRTLDRSDAELGVELTLAKKIVEMHGGTVTDSVLELEHKRRYSTSRPAARHVIDRSLVRREQ
jgi:signal transduction histidine kinase